MTITALSFGVIILATADPTIASCEPHSPLAKIEPFNPDILAHWSDKNYDITTHSKMVITQNSVYLSGRISSSRSAISIPYLIKYSLNGTLLWNITFFQYINNYSCAIDVFNGTIYLVLKSMGNMRITIHRFDENGNHLGSFLWLGETNPVIYSITHVRDSLFAIGQTSDEKIMLLKIDQNGMVVDEYTWGSKGSVAYGVASDGTYIYITGKMDCKEDNTLFVLKYDQNGTILWERRWGDYYGICPAGKAISVVGSNLYIVGYSDRTPPIHRAVLLNYDFDGNFIWSQISDYFYIYHPGYDISGFSHTLLVAVPCTADSSQFRVCIFKYDLNDDGDLDWIKVGKHMMPGLPGLTGSFISISATSEWNYFIATTLIYNGVETLMLMKGLIPTMPSNLVAQGDINGINLKWSLPTDYNDYPEYYLYRNLTSGNFSLYKRIPSNTFNYTDADVVRGVRYCYVISAVSGGHEGEKSDPACGVRYPSPPRNLSALSVGYKMVMLRWEPPYFIGNYIINGYNIYRSTASGMESFYRRVENVTSFVDLNASLDVTYFYKVTVIIANTTESDFSDEANATPSLGGTVPTPPKFLKASISGRAITLKWSPPEYNGGYSLIGYKIYRWIAQNNRTLITFLSQEIDSYTDISVIENVTYHYYVTAINLVGESPPSDEVTAIIPLTNLSYIKGIIKDEEMRIIQNATILLYQRSNNMIIKMIFSNSTGAFLIASISEGDYDLRIEKEGFEPRAIEGIHIGMNETKDLGIIILEKRRNPSSNSDIVWWVSIVILISLLLSLLIYYRRKEVSSDSNSDQYPQNKSNNKVAR